MGLEEKGNEGFKKILSIAEGSICMKNPDGKSERVITRKNDAGDEIEETIREDRFNAVTGMITKVNLEKGKYGMNLELTIEDDGEEFIIQSLFKTQKVESIVKRMPNIDHTAPLSIIAGKDSKDNKTFVYLKQHGETVPMKFTKDNRNGMPDWVTDEMGETDRSDYYKFLFEVAKEFAKRVNPAEEG